jgi:hypothetical protein
MQPRLQVRDQDGRWRILMVGIAIVPAQGPICPVSMARLPVAGIIGSAAWDVKMTGRATLTWHPSASFVRHDTPRDSHLLYTHSQQPP